MNRTCSNCKQELPLEDFPINKAKPSGHTYKCYTCTREYNKVHYHKHAEKYKPKKAIIRARAYKERQQWIWNYFSTHPCIECGESFPPVLEFDHVRGNKVSDISNMIHHGKSWSVIQEEIDKCEVRCVYCHRVITHIRRVLKKQNMPA